MTKITDLHFAPIKQAVLNLLNEGISADKKSHFLINKAVVILLADDWHTLTIKNPFYVLVVKYYLKLYPQKWFRFLCKIKLSK